MSEQTQLDSVIKDVVSFTKSIERAYDQKIDNIEAAQRFVIQNQMGIKGLVELNYREILKNRDEIKEVKQEVLKNNDLLVKILEKLS